MSENNSPKYYQVDIAVPQNMPENERRQLAACDDIFKRNWGQPAPLQSSSPGWASATILKDFGTFLMYQDFSDRRMVEIKTSCADQIEEVRKLPGVTVTETQPSGKYLVFGVYLNMAESEECHRLKQAGGREADKAYRSKLSEDFDKVVYPARKIDIRNAIAQHDPSATVHEVDNETAQAFFVQTRSDELLEALLSMDHIGVEESPPSVTTEAQFLAPYHKWKADPAAAQSTTAGTPVPLL